MLSERLDIIVACLLLFTHLRVSGAYNTWVPHTQPRPSVSIIPKLIKASRVAGKLSERLAAPAISSGNFLVFDVKRGDILRNVYLINMIASNLRTKRRENSLHMNSVNTSIMFPASTAT